VTSCDSDGTPVMVDASMVVSQDSGQTDAAPLSPDARDICSQGCPNGTCINGVCTIDCSDPGSCPTDITCPVNLPCHVICGDGSCGHKVNCTGALDCQIDCIGDNSCLDEIQCSSHRCEVTCSGQNACKRRTKCGNACGCDVTCSGAGSCAEASECPAVVCRVGNGCSSQPIGCEACP
jgi:hypothetical protein